MVHRFFHAIHQPGLTVVVTLEEAEVETLAWMLVPLGPSGSGGTAELSRVPWLVNENIRDDWNVGVATGLGGNGGINAAIVGVGAGGTVLASTVAVMSASQSAPSPLICTTGACMGAAAVLSRRV